MSRLTLREAFEYLCQQHQYNYDCLGGQPYDDGWKLKVSTGSSGRRSLHRRIATRPTHAQPLAVAISTIRESRMTSTTVVPSLFSYLIPRFPLSADSQSIRSVARHHSVPA